ncbi:hypothetical protein PR202_ga14956 [Eleusine coracana subsp. coracana]|uniref:Phosphatidic acid phosphatase type 2/haloperoxidase domain-containing protein n=1 Tax=Eleusine coracana subsp. coracana TaxID=191504 RepID=A0AAV5CIR2_ELECO|nr:hypothetical protein PR202_ga14956 [Eleusine coracana subsp. coracana]
MGARAAPTSDLPSSLDLLMAEGGSNNTTVLRRGRASGAESNEGERANAAAALRSARAGGAWATLRQGDAEAGEGRRAHAAKRGRASNAWSGAREAEVNAARRGGRARQGSWTKRGRRVFHVLPPRRSSMPPPPVRCGGAQHVYLKTHGTRVARVHLSDWVVLVLLVVIDGVLNIIEPFHRFVGEDMIPGLGTRSRTTPCPSGPCRMIVQVLAVVGPMVIIVGIYMKRRNVYDLHHAILGKFTAILVLSSEAMSGFRLLVIATLNAVILLQNYHNVTGAVICHGDKAVIKEGYKSFPSGHTSWSFAGLGFLSWYLAGKIMAFDRRGHVAKLCIIALPLLLAAMVAVSRVDDYWHHWQDVFTAGAMGVFPFCVGSVVFVLLPAVFPTTIWGTRYLISGLWPHSYFEHILTLEGEIQVQSTAESSHHQSLALDDDPSSGPVGIELRSASRLDSMEAGARFR